MLRKLDIDNNIAMWLPAYNNAKAGEKVTCPICGSTLTETIAKDLGEGIGYVTITCQSCGKTGYFSRVDFSTWNN